ncbi:bifunctional helix-turn-helix transcriptional regulator/GNAT family N-acetyltransferase [Bradyrhizobium sp. SYSU BS000235]|uniref:bifunctional helix-turn-helix transcriptional regulator/GNAT family N-acetyltransferase n=1 Tax=Bradyrhizobium sp. SYSU BS000235 TaxID=3411332 RepID=UPI003C78557A
MTRTYEADQISGIDAVRRFNRFYTRKIGVLDQQLLESPYSLTEARVLFELAHRDQPTAGEIGADLGLDRGYLSRIIQSFMDKGLVTRKPIPEDRRQFRLKLTAKGRQAFGRLNRSSHDDVGAMLQTLSITGKQSLIDAMTTIEQLLDGEAGGSKIVLRPHQAGDMGWVIQQHGLLYAQEYGWDMSFEALAADITAQFLKTFDPAQERCWIAEIDGHRVGSLFLVKESAEVAKLRLLLVDPLGRGRGLGKRLVEESVAFARACGYRKIMLWTQSILLAARGIYANAGFVHVASEPHHSFGQDLMGETWELSL